MDRALRLWLASPIQIYDYADLKPDENVWNRPLVDGPPHYTMPEGWMIESLQVDHEESWDDPESGTGWPASVNVVVTRVRADGKGRRKKDVVSAGSDPIEFMRELFALTEEN